MRNKTKPISIGGVMCGGDYPIRVQSMTTTKTTDIEGSVLQIQELSAAGCDYVRLTVQGKKEAYACEAIKNRCLQLGVTTPLIADIHFYPPAALIVADFFDKIRINPGNYAEPRATFRVLDDSEERYQAALQTVEEKLFPLIEKCKKRGVPIRLGVNHGSLSDRIMTRFGDTPKGMIMSAMEYAEICYRHQFEQLVISMKSSNPIIMRQAYLLLNTELQKRGWNFPIHLGVTEAGFGVEGRMKSAVGIGSLLLQGIGDTIRVSLTEHPVQEIAPCRHLRVIAQEERSLPSKPTPEENVKFILQIEEDEIEEFYKHEQHVWVDGIYIPGKVSSDAKTYGQIPEHTHYWSIDEINEKNTLRTGAVLGEVLCDRRCKGVVLKLPGSLNDRIDFGLTLFQACRLKTVKTEYISCPGCGRTLFDLQEVTQRIKEQTDHLVGVKIAIMGCIVNGPGEMADADFGFVGSGKGKVDLYVKKECVEKNIEFSQADKQLIELIKAHDKWVDKPDLVTLGGK